MFNSDELKFLRDQKISLEEVFDARNQSKSVWQQRARELGKNFVVGTPCKAFGHRLRTTAGHCIQCDTKKIAYQTRETIEQYLYIAVSQKGKLIKIGSTNDYERREMQLQNESYGGHSDWVKVFHMRAKNAASIERVVGQRLARHSVTGSYTKSGKEQDATEMFNCSYELALNEVYKTLKEKNVSPEKLWLHPGHLHFARSKTEN